MKIEPKPMREILFTKQKEAIDWDNIPDKQYLNNNAEANRALERLGIIKSTVLWLEKCGKMERFVLKQKLFGKSFSDISKAINVSKSTTYRIWQSALSKAEGLFSS